MRCCFEQYLKICDQLRSLAQASRRASPLRVTPQLSSTFRDFFSIDEDSLLPYLRDSADGIRLPFIECRSESEYRFNEVKPALLPRLPAAENDILRCAGLMQ